MLEETDFSFVIFLIKNLFWIIPAGLSFLGFLFWFFPFYGVWASKKGGEAALAESLNRQKIQINEAQSRLDAAGLNKQAAIIEAEAVAKQIEVIGNNLQKHDLYLKWQWIKMMEDNENADVIYVPTEAGLPILEANRLNKTRDES